MIGTLLGAVRPDGSVDVRNSYAVPHNEQNGQVFVDVEFHRAMAELHAKVNPAERVVGWYSTGDGVVPTDALIHEFFAHECAAPVHVTLDAGFAGQGKLMRAWTGKSVAIGASDATDAKAAAAAAVAAAAVACATRVASRATCLVTAPRTLAVSSRMQAEAALPRAGSLVKASC